MRRLHLTGIIALAILASACSKPQAPDKEQPPEPQAPTATGMRDAIQAPIDRAKAAGDAVQDAADAQDAAIEAAGG
ncbi:hypothetical protein H4F99_04445 [Lysobacter sp. SG-8]|uniref:Lipoprotein n=1 Tax=Marilutibacter penaei TaxID=2759900 RepID=A0A7W3YDF7_9GAMM|nr:hypothetical protein [Lysobacter penaei]MBB1087734.1 hypothetical protein [Lysobacter penaei]